MTTYELTNHACRRFAERFPGLSLRHELRNAIPFGGQFGGSQLLLSPGQAVFVVCDGKAVTTLTMAHAMANMQANHGELRAASTRVQVVPKDVRKALATAVIRPEIEAAVCELAIEHAERDDRGNKTIQATKKKRNVEVRRILGHENYKTKAVWEMYRAKYREARERLWAATREARKQLREASP